MEAEDRYRVTVLRGGKPTVIRPERVSEVVEEVACWRKANVIHRRFVENVQRGDKNCAHSPSAACFDLRMAVRAVAALFPTIMETIGTGYWKISSRAANQWLPVSRISSSNAESNLGRISLNVVQKKAMRIGLLIAGIDLRNPSGVGQASN
jgi:hypothetical protein